MHQRTQDGILYNRTFGKPDLFITFTCNPKRSEIVKELLTGQKSQDRHNILARIFRIKVKKNINLITRGLIFGETFAGSIPGTSSNFICGLGLERGPLSFVKTIG